MPDTVAPLATEPYFFVSCSQSVLMKEWIFEGGIGRISCTHNGDTVSAGTSVSLEEDVAAFVDRETAIEKGRC